MRVALDRIILMFDHGGSLCVKAEQERMSLAENISRPFPVLTKLGAMLRNVPALQFLWSKLVSLRRGTASDEWAARRFVDEGAGAVQHTVGQPIAASKRFDANVIAQPIVAEEPGLDPGTERERLIRRRWIETGIKMWNPELHRALKIQGRAGTLPILPGERFPGYDTLAFSLIDGRIVCEGVVVEPPKRRASFAD